MMTLFSYLVLTHRFGAQIGQVSKLGPAATEITKDSVTKVGPYTTVAFNCLGLKLVMCNSTIKAEKNE